MICPLGKTTCEGTCLAVKSDGQPFVCFVGSVVDVHPYVFWCLEAQMDPDYWKKGRDAHKCHSEILDRIGSDRTWLDGVKKRANEEQERNRNENG